MDSFVIDTNFFVNQEIKTGFGSTTNQVAEGFYELAKKTSNIALFFIPPTIRDELSEFVTEKRLWDNLVSIFTIKNPSVNTTTIPSHVLYEFVNEARERMSKGLKIGEEKIKDAAQFFSGKEQMDKIVFEKSIGPIITNFRDRYRNATRFQFIDSVADLDLIILALETNSHLVSSDEGVIRWGRKFGVKEQSPTSFQQKLLYLLSLVRPSA
jgi:hypothetical protein